MNRPMIPVLHRRIVLVLFVIAGLAIGSGCEELLEQPDETVRGAGSIDVPVQILKPLSAEKPS